MLMSEAGNLQAGTMLTINLRLRDEVFEASPIAQIILEEQGNLALINHQARFLFSLGIQNIGKPFRDLELHHYIPRLQSAIEQACSERCCSAIDNVRLETRQDIANFFDIQITPLIEGESKILGVNVSFIDVTRYQIKEKFNYQSLPILLVSGVDRLKEEQLDDSKADDIIYKPFDLDILISRVAELIA